MSKNKHDWICKVCCRINRYDTCCSCGRPRSEVESPSPEQIQKMQLLNEIRLKTFGSNAQ